jgi:hypothetical protein
MSIFPTAPHIVRSRIATSTALPLMHHKRLMMLPSRYKIDNHDQRDITRKVCECAALPWPQRRSTARSTESRLISAGLRAAPGDKARARFFFGQLARVVRIDLGKANLIARPHFDCRRFHRYFATKSCSRNFRMAGAAIAPAWCATSIPFLKIDIVGIAVTRKRRAKLGSSSVLTLATRT